MIGATIETARWQVSPMLLPSDAATQDRMESVALNVAADGVRSQIIEQPRHAPLTVGMGGSIADPEGSPDAGFTPEIEDAERAGRARVGHANDCCRSAVWRGRCQAEDDGVYVDQI